MILTGGDYAGGVPPFERPNFIMIAEELPVCPKAAYTAGVKLITVAYQRELPHVKSVNYLNSIRLAPLKLQNGCLRYSVSFHPCRRNRASTQ